MTTSSQSLVSPLSGEVTIEHRRKLGKMLWRWKLCEDCDSGSECRTAHCPWKHAPSLALFFNYYRIVTAAYVPEELFGDLTALRTHEDLLAVIGSLKACTQVRRSAITRAHFTQRAAARGETALPPLADQHRAFSLAARIIAMVNASAEDGADGLVESAALPITWEDDISFADFLQAAFPTRDDAIQTYIAPQPESWRSTRWTTMTANSLQKMAGLRLMPTNNLQNHLRLDLEQRTVEIYHHTSVLKQHLLSSIECDADADMAEQISEGNIPRELALETLLTLREILFPLDTDSQALLRRLVTQKSFDRGCLEIDSWPYRRADEKAVSYRYWGARLDDLYSEMQDPTPSGYSGTWTERRSGVRYATVAAAAGVLVAIVLAALSLAVNVFEAWVGYQQWKHPVNAAVSELQATGKL